MASQRKSRNVKGRSFGVVKQESMSLGETYSINPIPFNENNFVGIIRSRFGLTSYPFTLIDDDLLICAFIPRCDTPKYLLSSNVKSRIRSKYLICDHQSLEYYGDRLLYSIISDYIIDLIGINNPPGLLTEMISFLTNNETITYLMNGIKACELVRSRLYTISNQKGRTHNICGDSFEALIGVMFITFRNLDFNYVMKIKEWVVNNTDLTGVVRKYLDDINKGNITVYKGSNKVEIYSKYVEEFKSKFSDLEPEEFDLIRGEMLTINDLPDKTLVVSSKESLQSVYRILGWRYAPPNYDEELGSYFMFGYPNGKRYPIGVGDTMDEVINDTFISLVNLGFIIRLI